MPIVTAAPRAQRCERMVEICKVQVKSYKVRVALLHFASEELQVLIV